MPQSRPELIANLACRAADQIAQKPVEKARVDVGKALRTRDHEELLGEVSKLAEERHRIIHEASEPDIDKQRVFDVFTKLLLLCDRIAEWAQGDEVPVRRREDPYAALRDQATE